MSLKHLPVTERPREKLLLKGPLGVSDAELLAVLFGSGTRQYSAMTIACNLLNQFGSLRGVMHATRQGVCKIQGIGDMKYAQLKAVLELNKRVLEEPLKKRPVFQHCSDVESFLKAQLRAEEKEHFGVMSLTSQHHLIAFRVLFSGTINTAAVYPREVVRQVINDNAAAVILVHNHPSGVPEPSDADIRLTRDVASALALIDVSVLDHFIVGGNRVLSFAQRGLM